MTDLPRTELGSQLSAPAPPDESRVASRGRRDAGFSDFAVVVPAYNEVENIPRLLDQLRETFRRHRLEGEVVLVDDGSTDGTYEAAVREAAGWERLTILRHRKNAGKTEALLTAVGHTDAGRIVLFDADLQHSTEEIPRYLARMAEGWDIVTGRKVGPYEKRRVSAVYNWLSRRLFHLPVRDLNSMKAFRREILDEIALRHDWHRFFVALAYAQGYSVTEIDIELHPREAGESKYTGTGRVLVGMGDLLVVWFYLKFSRKPMEFFGGSGLILIALGIVVGLVAIVLRVGGWMPPFGYRPLLTLVLLLEMMGVVLFGVGFLAELIATLRAEVDELRRRLRGPG